MNREIKFRGYGIAEKKWMYGYGLHEVIYRYENGETKATWLTTDIKNISMVHDKSAGEYTGIKDYEGKEIYEGDIVEVEIMESIFDDSKLIGVVEMIEGCWCVVNDKKKVAKNLWSEMDVNRVIGNIYENKELLEVE
nr:MAG TPA: YopX protein [Caudoviricetes sp.]